MGMYTKFNIILPIKVDTPQNIKDILIDMIENGGDKAENGELELPKHDFFVDGTRYYFAQCSSYYFTGTSNSKIQYCDTYNKNNDIKMVLHIDCDFKNYENEINLFLDWVQQYVDEDNYYFLGYSQYEEDCDPTLYFINKGKILKFTNNNIREIINKENKQ